MKIVVSEPIYLTDEYRRRLEALGDLRAYDSVPASDEDFVSRIKDAEIVIAGRYGFSGESVRRAPELKLIALWQTGYDNVDLAAATALGVKFVSLDTLLAQSDVISLHVPLTPETEPLPMDSPLLGLDNVVLTPHIAFLSRESIDECTRVTVENVEMFVKGRPRNVVNRSVLAKKAEEGLA